MFYGKEALAWNLGILASGWHEEEGTQHRSEGNSGSFFHLDNDLTVLEAE